MTISGSVVSAASVDGPAAHPTWWRRAGDVVLGTDPKQRVRLSRTLLGHQVFFAVIALRFVGVGYDMVSVRDAAIVALYDLIGIGVIYAVLRSGYTLRFKDPALSLFQILFAVSALVLSYALVEASRSVSLQLLCLILVFGMYRLSSAQILLVGLSAVGMLVGMLLLMWRAHAEGFDMRQETLNIALAAVMLPTLSVVARQVGRMRQRLIKQRADMTVVLEQLHQLATRDVLTGLVNRHYMNDLLRDQFKRVQRNGRPSCLAILDIDHFKQVNDRLGHQAGDEVLISFAKQASAGLGPSDVICRWGGEEFLVFLPEATSEEAAATIERLRDRLHILLPADAQGQVRQVTFSAGVAQLGTKWPLDDVMEAADRALYEAKEAGRNRVVIAKAEKTAKGHA